MTAAAERGEGRGPSTAARRGAARALRLALGLALGAKLVVVALWCQGTLFGGPAVAVAASERAPATSNAPGREGGAPTAPGVRTLVEAVARRQAELDEREREIKSREERLQLFEKDVAEKIASLEEIEKRLQSRAKAASAGADAAAESLAKVYAAMKPAEAAPILDRLDDPTVLTIFSRMKEKQIGEILPLMSRDKAIVLTRSLAERR